MRTLSCGCMECELHRAKLPPAGVHEANCGCYECTVQRIRIAKISGVKDTKDLEDYAE